ncbi:MAG: DUF2341 domain-containing protein [Spirochaetota bacterium]
MKKQYRPMLSIAALCVTFSVAIAGCTDPGLFDLLGEQNPPWLLDTSTHRRRLILENTAGSEALANVPVKVTLNDETFDYAQTDGTDLRFYGNDHETELYYEIERWDETGTSVIWVLVDAIEPETRDYFWMYWGSEEATAFHDSTKVWADYVLVLHFNDNLDDSSPSGYNGVATGTISYEAGVAGNGLVLEDGERVDYDGYATDHGATELPAYTVEVWFKAIDTPQVGSAGSGPVMAQNHFNIGWDHSTVSYVGSYHFDVEDTGAGLHSWQAVPQTTQYVANSPYYVAAVFDGAAGSAKSYRNAALDGELTGLDARTDTGPTYLRLGTDGSRAYFFEGVIDEVRVSFKARSAAWIDAQYRSLQGELVELGTVEGK